MSIILKTINQKHWHHQHKQIHSFKPSCPSTSPSLENYIWKNIMQEFLITMVFHDFLSFNFFPMARQPLMARASSFSKLHKHTTFSRTPWDEWTARCRDLYLTTHNTHKRQTPMLPVGFEHTIPSKRATTDTSFRPCSHWDQLKF
jgi:hypothetical protein